MTRRVAVALGERPAPGSLIVPSFAALFVAVVSMTLLLIGANSPYTHANLAPGYDRAYDRTAQVVVGSPVPYAGIGGWAPPADQISRGERLFVTKACVTCHGLGGQGGVVGPAIEHSDAETIAQRTHLGPRGMPRFSDALTEDQIEAISAYLRSRPDAR